MASVILEAVLHHHEALDGIGYPDRLWAEEIGPLTCILTVCDIFAAVVEERAYKRDATGGRDHRPHRDGPQQQG